MLLGDGAAGAELNLPFSGMLAAALPPGAFFGLALLIALRNLLIRPMPDVTPPRIVKESPS